MTSRYVQFYKILQKWCKLNDTHIFYITVCKTMNRFINDLYSPFYILTLIENTQPPSKINQSSI